MRLIWSQVNGQEYKINGLCHYSLDLNGKLWIYCMYSRIDNQFLMNNILFIKCQEYKFSQTGIIIKFIYFCRDNVDSWDIRYKIPGRAGIDYPNYYEAPETSFSCQDRHDGE